MAWPPGLHHWYRGGVGIVITSVCMCLCVRLSAKLLADLQTQWMRWTTYVRLLKSSTLTPKRKQTYNKTYLSQQFSEIKEVGCRS